MILLVVFLQIMARRTILNRSVKKGRKQPCVYSYVYLGAYVCALTCRSDEEVQDFCSAGKLFWETRAPLCALRHAHRCCLLSIQLVCLSQPVLPQLNPHRNRINKSPAQTALKGTWQCWEASWIQIKAGFYLKSVLIMCLMNCNWLLHHALLQNNMEILHIITKIQL